jgi:hypothetical protein
MCIACPATNGESREMMPRQFATTVQAWIAAGATAGHSLRRRLNVPAASIGKTVACGTVMADRIPADGIRRATNGLRLAALLNRMQHPGPIGAEVVARQSRGVGVVRVAADGNATVEGKHEKAPVFCGGSFLSGLRLEKVPLSLQHLVGMPPLHLKHLRAG